MGVVVVTTLIVDLLTFVGSYKQINGFTWAFHFTNIVKRVGENVKKTESDSARSCSM